MSTKTTPFRWSKTKDQASIKQFYEWKSEAYKTLDHDDRQAFVNWLDLWGQDIYSNNHIVMEDWILSTKPDDMVQTFLDCGGSDQPELALYHVGQHRAQVIDAWWFDARYEINELWMEHETLLWHTIYDDEHRTMLYDMDDLPLVTHLFLNDFNEVQQYYNNRTMYEWIKEITPEEFAEKFWQCPNLREYFDMAERHTTPHAVFDQCRFY